MQRLTLAVMLYKSEHGKMPDENWAAQITPYLGKNADQYFSCPSHPSSKGETTYALVQYGDTIPVPQDARLVVERFGAVPLDRAVVSIEEVGAWKRKQEKCPHPGGMNVAYRSGAVRWALEPREPSAWDNISPEAFERLMQIPPEQLNALIQKIQTKLRDENVNLEDSEAVEAAIQRVLRELQQ
jgi:hypothetical protein